ncbi:MAG: uroporphyrinogen-III C-methyltransferase [Actinomycetota bacterium]|nr:uroporphyrinogen-III C-methyltransferase [Actinomycetota bacterium]
MTGYPLLLDVTGRRVVVVGGGSVAIRRALGLIAAGALVEVVAPEMRTDLFDSGAVLHQRRYVAEDLPGAWLVLACTDDPDVNTAVAGDAERLRIWCVRADAATGGTARVPAVARSGALTVAVNAGDDPRLAIALRDAIRLQLDTGVLPVRGRRTEPGRVSLVGGGPGDEGLITVRGRRLVAEADVLVVDNLAPRSLLSTVGTDVEVVEAGKSPGRQTLTQDQINEVLVSRARAGLHVVRLKGGDPFVFGRGGEEALACIEAGMPVEVVPGVTSAIAGPAYAGIPLTHRGVSTGFAVVSAHRDPTREGAAVDWAPLAAGPATLVLLMAVGKLTEVAAELIKHGRPAATPVAVVQDATLLSQAVLVSTLEGVAADAEAAGVRPPAVVVVGEVVRLRDRLQL